MPGLGCCNISLHDLPNSFWISSLWNLACPRLISQLPIRFEISHRARQWYCHALCKISKWLGNRNWCNGPTRFCKIWVRDFTFGGISNIILQQASEVDIWPVLLITYYLTSKFRSRCTTVIHFQAIILPQNFAHTITWPWAKICLVVLLQFVWKQGNIYISIPVLWATNRLWNGQMTSPLTHDLWCDTIVHLM